MTKNVEIVIKADDQASASLKKIGDSAKGADEDFKRIKESGQQAKASTEAFAQVLSILGQGQLAGLAGAFTSIADKMKDIKGESESWQAQMVATKAVVAIGVFAAAVAVGKKIGEWVFQTGAANRELERTKQLASDIYERLADTRGRRIAEEVDAIKDIVNFEERRVKAKEMQAQLNRDIETTSARIESLIKEIGDREASFLSYISGNFAVVTESKRHELELAQRLLETYRDHNQTLLNVLATEKQITGEYEFRLNLMKDMDEAVDRLQNFVDRRNEQEKREREREQDRIEREKESKLNEIIRVDDAIRKRSERAPQSGNPALESRLLSRVTTDDKTVERDQLAELRAQKELLQQAVRELERQAQRNKDTLQVDIVQ